MTDNIFDIDSKIQESKEFLCDAISFVGPAFSLDRDFFEYKDFFGECIFETEAIQTNNRALRNSKYFFRLKGLEIADFVRTELETRFPGVKSFDEIKTFRFEILTVLRTGIKQRSKLLIQNKSRLVISPDHQKVINDFSAIQNSWSLHRIVKYIIDNQQFILEIIPGSNPTLKQRFENILQVAPDYLNS